MGWTKLLRLDTTQDMWPVSCPCHLTAINMLCILVQVACVPLWWVAFPPKSPATQWGIASAREGVGGRKPHSPPSPETWAFPWAKGRNGLGSSHSTLAATLLSRIVSFPG